MEEENFREEEKRIVDIRTARMEVLRDAIREARMEVPKFLLGIEKKYIIKIDDEYKIDMKILKEKKDRARRR